MKAPCILELYLIPWLQQIFQCFVSVRVGKHGSLVVSALASGARGSGFDPRGRKEKISVSEHALISLVSFAGMTLNVPTPSARDVNWRPPM